MAKTAREAKKPRKVCSHRRRSSASISGDSRARRFLDPANRFEKLHIDLGDADVVQVDESEEERPRRETQYFRDGTKTILSHNDSPDIGFDTSINPYRGCEHGCIYCYARPTHEYLGFSAGLDFESKIMVKTDAPELLRAELESPRWQPQVARS